MSTFLGVPLAAAYHVVAALVTVLTPVFGGLAAAAAIVAFTMGIRLLLAPLSYRALRGLDAQAKVAPQVQALRKKHTGQPEKLRAELAALYRAEGTSGHAGCLPLLLQWPFLSVMYLLFRSPHIGGAPNSLLTHDLFAAPLASHWLGGAGPMSAQGAVFAALFVLIAAIGWGTARITRRLSTANVAAGQAPALLARLTPYMTVVFAAFLPLAAVLYLATTAAWTLLERLVLRRVASRVLKPRDAD